MPRNKKESTTEARAQANAERNSVRGTIRRANGRPLAGAIVRAFDIDFRSEEMLGQATTDVAGSYDIGYTAAQFRRAEKKRADLRLRVFVGAGRLPAKESEVFFNAPAVITIDLTMDATQTNGPFEFDELLASVRTLANATSPAEFTEEDIKFLSTELGTPDFRVAFLSVAHRHAQLTRVPAAAFYAFFRENLPTGLDALLLSSPKRWTQALKQAVEGLIVSPTLEAESAKIVAALEAARNERVVGKGEGKEKRALDVLTKGGISNEVQKKFAALLTTHEGSAEDFWTALRATKGITKEQADDVEFTVSLAALTDNNGALVRLLKGRGKSLEDLAALRQSDWEALIDNTRNGILPLPDGIEGADEKARITNYAKYLVNTLRAVVPMAAFRHDIKRAAADPLRKQVADVLDKAPDLDLNETRLESYLKTNPKVLEGAADKQAVIRELKRYQRLFNIAPRHDHMQALMARGFDSAFGVVGTPRAAFIEQMQDVLGDDAPAYYAKAQQKAAVMQNAMTSIYQHMNDLAPSAIPNVQSGLITTFPNWEKLFGSIDLCDCDHCRSVYGPAAYFVDLLQYIRKSGDNVFNVLRKRRPDLPYLQLTCENTNTALPYVDLVNEVLEYYVVHGDPNTWVGVEAFSLSQQMAKDTGDATAEELSINPQYREEAAYTKLKNAVFTPLLPFNRPLEITRAYLGQLGTSLNELMTTFRDTATPVPSNLDVAREALGFSPEEMDIIINLDNDNPWRFFGYPNSQSNTWKNNLEKVPEFLRRSDLTYPELVDALKTRFINPNPNPPAWPDNTVVLYAPNSSCDLDKTKIQHLQDSIPVSNGEWLQLHRFLRLRKKLGWTFTELDQACHTFGATAIDSLLVRRLANLSQLRSMLNLPIERVLSFWAPIDTHGEASLYQRLFQNKTVTNPVDPAFALNAAGTELADTTATFDAHPAALLAALRIGAEDLARLREALGLADPAATLSLASISALFRHAVLAKAMRLKIRDFLTLVALAGENIFAGSSATLRFVKRAETVKASAFSPVDMNYLFRHISQSNPAADPAQDKTLIFLSALQQGLVTIAQETTPVSDPEGTFLNGWLSEVLEAAVLDTATAIIEINSPLTVAAQEAFIDQNFGKFLDTAEAKTTLLGASNLELEERRQANRDYVTSKILPYLRVLRSRGLVKQMLSTDLKLDAEVTNFLLEELLESRLTAGQKAIADFLALADEAMTPESRRPDYARLNKIALLLNGWDVTPQEASYIAEHGADFGNFDWDALPLDRADAAGVDAQAPALFAAWEKLNAFFSLRDRLPSQDLTLLHVVGAANAVEARATLATLAGWDGAELEMLSAPAALNLTEPAFKNAEGPQRLYDALALARKTGVSVGQLFEWSRSTINAARALAVVQAVKAKYDDTSWLTVGKLLNDGLREKQRAALVAYVLSDEKIIQKKLTTPDQLFEHFLIDVSMDPTFKTSRIKQGISSLQMFIQRCLMNLEGNLASKLDAQRWQWMKNYRVWEANRKVFLYPENWIEPELRDDKTPFFKELESQLLQSELTTATAEKAFMDYLEKVEGISNIEIASLCYDDVLSFTSRTKVVHVFGRKRNTPREHYYRSYNILTGEWTAWEPLPFEIDGEHLVPAMHNGRLHLFWPIFTEKSGPAVPELFTTITPPDGNVPLWNIRMGWSERRDGRWTPKHISADSINSYSYGYISSFQTSKMIDGYKELVTEVTRKIILPAPGEHAFRVKYLEGNILAIQIFLKGLVFEEDSWNDTVYHTCRIGSFTIGSCGSRMMGEPASAGYSYADEEDLGRFWPAYADIQDMAYHEKWDGSLTFHDWNQSSDVPVLGATLDDMRVVTPRPGQIASSVFFPFTYQDTKRAYLAVPWVPEKKLINPGLITGGMKISDGIMQSFLPSQQMKTTGSSNNSLRWNDSGTTLGTRRVHTIGTERVMGKDMSVSLMSGNKFQKKDNSSFEAMPAGPDFNLGIVDSGILGQTMKVPRFHFLPLSHPFLCTFENALNRNGIKGLLTLANQKLTNDPAGSTVFKETYEPQSNVSVIHPREIVDFSGDANSIYNWEIFFHVPMLIADRLTKNQRFEEAMKWFHYVFNPMETSTQDPTPQRYWRVKPFQITVATGIEDMLKKLSSSNSAIRESVVKQVERWRKNPFNPHLIARFRHPAYMKYVVMKYIDNIIQWADQLFARDTIESINEATQLYVLAYELLGPRPQSIPPRGTVDSKTYMQLRPDLDEFSNALVDMENEFPFASDSGSLQDDDQSGSLGVAQTFYFGIPKNDKLMGYWDLVEDRLFKIRHSMNIEGLVRSLPLFEPPIDPALLVKAAAAGLDLSSVLSDLSAPLPPYRFAVLIQRATELCNEVRSLSSALLGALEKKDAEALSALRSSHEATALELVRSIKKAQIEEARQTLESLNKTREAAEARREYYKNIPLVIDEENTHLAHLEESRELQTKGEKHQVTAGQIAAYAPDVSAGASVTGPYAGVTLGRANVIAAFESEGQQYQFKAGRALHESTLAKIKAEWQRRANDWKFQMNSAQRDINQITKQIAAAEIRMAITENELDNHIRLMENAGEVEDFLRDKYTNEELYVWMSTQLSSVYFQMYKLAYETAKRAEKAYRYERGLADSSFIQFGYWDGARKGLLAGEKLMLDIKRLQAAHTDQNRREYEIAKPVSLLRLDPAAFIALKQNGICEIELPEALFDMDYPGHYMRRLKTVKLTLPCVTGPYVSVNCTLTLLSSKVRVSPNAQADYPEDLENEDARFTSQFGAIQSVATSTAQDDSGLFEVNFNDERYLPFEGAGAVSRWRLELSQATNAFDVDTLADAILHVSYTAREGGGLLKKKALASVVNMGPKENLNQLFSARHEFSDAWYRFLHPQDADTVQSLALDLSKLRFPFQFRNQEIRLNGVSVLIKLKDGLVYEGGSDLPVTLANEDSTFADKALSPNPTFGLPQAKMFGDDGDEAIGAWTLTINEAAIQTAHPALRKKLTVGGTDRWRLNPEAIEDIWVLCRYTVG